MKREKKKVKREGRGVEEKITIRERKFIVGILLNKKNQEYCKN